MKNVTVRLTDHFLERLYERRDDVGFNASKFFAALPALVKLGHQHLGVRCLVALGACKLIFTINTYNERVIATFVTVMPKRFNHSIDNKLQTVNLGEIA